MLAGVLERLLKSALSRWLSVTASHLQVMKVGAWAGEVHLQQLHMLAGVLDELHLPLGLGVKLRKGMVGTLQIKCNWARLTTQPVEVRLADVYLLGEIDPSRLAEARELEQDVAARFSPEVLREYLQSQKAAIIAAAETSWEQMRSDSTAAAAASQSYMSSFTASIVASVLDNLSVTVQRIHVCIATAPRRELRLLNQPSGSSNDRLAPPQLPVELQSASPDLVSPQPLLSPSEASAGAAAAAAESSPVPPLLSLSSPLIASGATSSAAGAGAACADPSGPSFPVGWSLGVVLSQLSIHATDKSGRPSFVKSTGRSVFKQVRLEQFGVYLCSNATPLPDAAEGSDQLFMKLMAKPFAKQHNAAQEQEQQHGADGNESEQEEEEAQQDAEEEAEHAEVSVHSDSSSSGDEVDGKDRFEDARDAQPLQLGSESSSPVLVPQQRKRSRSSSQPRGQHADGSSGSKQAFERIKGLEYILCPCDATVKLRLAKSHGISSAAADEAPSAKIELSVAMESLNVEFTAAQYAIVQALAANISSSEHALRHAPFLAPRLRPGHSQQVTRAWWAYALGVTRKECRERLDQWDPTRIHEYREDLRAYAPLYAAQLSGRLTPAQDEEMQRLEAGWEAHHIVMWRSLFHKQNRIDAALAAVNKQRGKQKKAGKGRKGAAPGGDAHSRSSAAGGDAAEGSKSVMGWLGSWISSGSSDASSSSSSSAANANEPVRLSEAEREQILEMLGYDPYASLEQMSLQAAGGAGGDSNANMKVDFKLGSASIALFQSEIAAVPSLSSFPPPPDPASLPSFPLAPRSLTSRQAFLIASLADFTVRVQQGLAGVSVELSLDHLLVEDRLASADRFGPLIVPRAYQPPSSRGQPLHTGGMGTPFQTPPRRKLLQPDASPLMLPAGAVHFCSASPDLHSLAVPEPPLLQLRLSYHFPSQVLPAAASQAHIDLWLVTQPLDVVYSAGAIATLQNFLLTPSSQAADPSASSGVNVLWQELEVAALNAFQDLKRRSAAKLDYVLNHHVRITLDVNIQAPTLLIYHHQRSDQGSCLAINLGHVTCNTEAKDGAPGSSSSGSNGMLSVQEPEHSPLAPSSLRGSNADLHPATSAWSISSTLEATNASTAAAAARERALSGGSSGPASPSGQSATETQQQRSSQQLFYDQFRLVIQNVDVQLVPLWVDACGGRTGVRGSPAGFTPYSAAHAAGGGIPELELPEAHAGSFLTGSSKPQPYSLASPTSPKRSSRSSARKAWLARRRNISTRSTRSCGCGPVIDAFTPTLHVWSSVLPSDTSLPRMKVYAHLPPLKLHLSSAKMRRILDILASFPSTAAAAAPAGSSPPVPSPSGLAHTASTGAANSSGPLRSIYSTPEPYIGGGRPSMSRRSTSLRENAAATAAKLLESSDARETDATIRAAAAKKLPADWVMLHFQLVATQLSIDLSFDCDAPPEQLASPTGAFGLASPGAGAQPPASSGSTFELVSFLLEGVELSFTKFPYSFALETQVHGLFLQDCINREHAAYRFLIASGASPRLLQAADGGSGASPESKEHEEAFAAMSAAASAAFRPAATQSALTGLIYLRFRHDTDDSPTASAASTDELQLDFNTLAFNLNRKTIQLLVEFAQPALDAMAQPAPPVAATASSPPGPAGSTGTPLHFSGTTAPGHHHFDSTSSTATEVLYGGDMSRSVDFSASQLPSHAHSSSAPINMSASFSHPFPTAASTPATPERSSSTASSSVYATPLRSVSAASSSTPSQPAVALPIPAQLSQQELLQRINDKILSEGDVGGGAQHGTKRAAKFRPIPSSLSVHARINLISLSLNQENEHEDHIATLCKTEMQGLTLALQHHDCPCGGCTQVNATLANLNVFEILTTAPDNYSTLSRRSETSHLHVPRSSSGGAGFGHHSLSSSSLRDVHSPVHSDTPPHRNNNAGPGGWGSPPMPATRQKRIFSAGQKRQASDTALVTFAFTQHALVMDGAGFGPASSGPSSSSCPIRFRTSRHPINSPVPPPVDPATLAFDQTLSVKLSSVQVVLVPEFLRKVQLYAGASMLKDASDRAALEAKKAFTELKQLAEANCSLLQYSVHIENPLIFVPHTTSQPVNRPILSSPSPSPQAPLHSPGGGSSMAPASPMHGFGQAADLHPLYDDIRMRTDYLVLDLGKISLCNSFGLSEHRHVLVPPENAAAANAPASYTPQPMFSPRRSSGRRKSLAPAGRVPKEHLQLAVSSINLILASPGPVVQASAATAGSSDSGGLSSSLHSSSSGNSGDDAGLFWLGCVKKKVFEDVHVSADVSLVMLVPHLAFDGVPNVSVRGTVSTIHAHISEQLLTFMLGVYTVELAPLLAPLPTTFEDEQQQQDDMMEFEVEEEPAPRPPPRVQSTAALPRPSLPRAASFGVAGVPSTPPAGSSTPRSAAGGNAESKESDADLLANIDEELDEAHDAEEAEDVAPIGGSTSEMLAVALDLTFEGVLLDLMLTPPPTTHVAEDEAPLHSSRQSRPLPSFFSPGHASFLSPGAALSSFPFAPRASIVAVPHRPQPFMQIRAKSLKLSFRLTNIVATHAEAEAVRSALTAVELSLGHLSLEDMRPALGHLLLKQVIGGHKDYITATQAPSSEATGTSGAGSKRPLHNRTGSIAFDLSAALPPSSLFSPAPAHRSNASADMPASAAAAAPPQTVLPDLKVKFESLSVLPASAPAEEGEDAEMLPAAVAAPASSVTVETSVDVEFTAPRLVISPNFLHALVGFADSYQAIVDAGLHADDRSEARMPLGSPPPAAVAAAPAAPTAAPANESRMRIHARIRDPQVWLMSDVDTSATSSQAAGPGGAFASTPQAARHSVSAPAGRFPSELRDSGMPQQQAAYPRPLSCVVVRANLEANVTLAASTSVSASVSDIEALMCYRAHHLRLAELNPQPVPVFKPFFVKADYQLRLLPPDVSPAAPPRVGFHPVAAGVPAPAGGVSSSGEAAVSEQHVTVEVGLLDSCFSFLQMSSAANILLALAAAVPASEQTKPPPPAHKSSAPASTSPVAFLANFRGVAQVKTNGIQLALVNDAPGYYVPLLSFAINPLLLSVLDSTHPETVHSDVLEARPAASAGGAPSYLSPARFAAAVAQPRQGALLMVTASLGARYYNKLLGEWEPFLSDYRFDVRADEQHIVLSSQQLLVLQVTPACVHALAQGMDSLRTHFLSVLAAAPVRPAATKRTSSSARRTDQRARSTRNQSQQPHPQAASPVVPAAERPGNKASYFRVRNETGCRLRFWSVEVEHSGGVGGVDGVAAAAQELQAQAAPSFTVEPQEEQTVALRQYIGVGGIGGLGATTAAGEGKEQEESKSSSEEAEEKTASENKMRWLYRSPMLGLQLEAGRGTERWDAWHPIQAVPLVASSNDAPGDSSGAMRSAVHAHTNLTLHPLLPSPEHDTHLTDPYAADDLSASVLACHLVSQPDAFGSAAQVLVVSSALLLVNRTFVDLEVCLIDSVAEEVLFQQLVRSGQSLPMPVLLVSWRRVKLLLRPAGVSYHRTEWEWSSAGFRLSMLHYDAARHTVLKCQPHAPENVPTSPLFHQAQGVTDREVFCCGINVFSTAAVSSANAAPDATASLSLLGDVDVPEPTLYTIALDPPLSFKNLLGCDVSYQVVLRSRREDASFVHTRPYEHMDEVGRMAGFLPHRQEVHWYHMDLGAAASSVVTLQLRRGDRDVEEERVAAANGIHTPNAHARSQPLVSSAAGAAAAVSDWSSSWSSEVVIHSTTDVSTPASSLILHDREGIKLRIQLDYSAPQLQAGASSAHASIYPYAHAGEGLVTAFVPHWFANQSGLPLVYSSVDDSVDSDDVVQLCAGQSPESLRQAAQALMDIEGVDELALARRRAAFESGESTGVGGGGGKSGNSWFHFRAARRQFGTEARSGLHALLSDPEQVVSAWKWRPELARRPLDENVFLLSPVSRAEELAAAEAREQVLFDPQPVEVYLLPLRGSDKRRAMLRLPNTDWSQPFNVDTVGWDGALQLTERVQRGSANPSSAATVVSSAYDQPRPAERPLRVYTLGVSICMHPHLRFHRTKIVKVAPRYILSNQTLHTLEFRQIGSDEVRTLAPKQRLPIHWLDVDRPVALSFRVGSYGWVWAAPRFGIALESVGVFSVRLRNPHTHDTAVMHVWTTLKAATFEITIMATWEQQQQLQRQQNQQRHVKNSPAMLRSSDMMDESVMDLNSSLHAGASQMLGGGGGMGGSSILLSPSAADDRDLAEKTSEAALGPAEPVPFRIENRSSMRTLQFHQAGEERLLQRLLPFQSCPYAWDEPSGTKEIVLYCVTNNGPDGAAGDAGSNGNVSSSAAGQQRVGSYSLDRIARYPTVWLPHGRDASEHAKLEEDQVFVQVYAHGRVRVLKLVDLAWANSAGLTQTQASLNDAASRLPAAPAGWSVELQLAGIGLSLITHVQRSSAVYPASSSLALHRGSSTGVTRPSPVSSHPLALLGVPYTRQELLHLSIQSIRVRMAENSSTQTQSIKASIGHIQLDNQLHAAVYPVVLCSVSRAQSSSSRWPFGGQKDKITEPELDLQDSFFNVNSASSSPLALTPHMLGVGGVGGGGSLSSGMGRAPTGNMRAGGRKAADVVPCWFSLSVLRSHERSTDDFLFLPGLAVRMSLLKINVEEKLVNHLLRFGELLAPAIALLAKAAPVAPVPAPSTLAQMHGGGTSMMGSGGAAQQLFGLAMHDVHNLSSSPLPSRSAGGSSFTPESESGSLSPASSLPESYTDAAADEEFDLMPADETFHVQHAGGVIGRLVPPSATEAPPLSSLDYARIDMHQRDLHASGKATERESSGSTGPSSSAAVAQKLERPLILYFQQLIVHTIEIQVSISSSGEQGEDDGSAASSSSAHPLRVLLRAVGATLLNFEDASLKFGALQLPDVFASGEELAALVQLHYLKQASRQFYQLLGSSDFLGNPTALFSSISTGFGELISKPALGLTESPTGVVTGAFGGLRSFVQHVLFGVSSAGSKVTSSIAKGLSALSMSDARQLVTVSQLFRLPRDGWKHRGARGVLGGSMRALLGMGGIAAHRTSRVMEGMRTLLNPLAKLQRAREPLFFQSGTRPRIFHLRMARFITAYLAQHPHETFVAAVEQETSTPLQRPVFFKGSPAVSAWTHPASPLPSSAAGFNAAAAAASPSAALAAMAGVTQIRAPGGRVCLLLTSHTLVLFAIYDSAARTPRLLHALPLETLNVPVESFAAAAGAHFTLVAIDPLQQEQNAPVQQRRGAAALQRRSYHARLPPPPRAAPPVLSSAAHATLAMLPRWLIRVMAGEPTLPATKLALPLHLSPTVAAHMDTLILAARVQRQQELAQPFSTLPARR